MARGNPDTEKRRHRICHTTAELINNYSEQSFEFMDSEDEDVDSESDAYICQGCHVKYDASLSLCHICGYVNPDFTKNKKTRKLSLDGTFPKERREKKAKNKRKRSYINFEKSERANRSRKYRDNRKHIKHIDKVNNYRRYKKPGYYLAKPLKSEKHKFHSNPKKQKNYDYHKRKPLPVRTEKNLKPLSYKSEKPKLNGSSIVHSTIKQVMGDLIKTVEFQSPKEERIYFELNLKLKKIEDTIQKCRNNTYNLFKNNAEVKLDKSIDVSTEILGRCQENENRTRNGSSTSILSENGSLDSFVDLTSSDDDKKCTAASSKPKFVPKAHSKPKVLTKDKVKEEVFDDSKESRQGEEIHEFHKPKITINKKVKRQEGAFRQLNKIVSERDMERIQEERVREAKLKIKVKEERLKREYFSIANFNKTSKFVPLFCQNGVYPDFSVNDPYRVLGVYRSVSLEDAKKQLKGLRVVFHPDKNSHPKAISYFVKVGEAYNEICKIRKV